MKSFFGWLSNKWECDDLSVLSEENPLKFLGMEIHSVDGGIEVCQEGFIRELLRAHQHDGARSKTQGSKENLIMSAEEEAMMLEAAPVRGQGELGERGSKTSRGATMVELKVEAGYPVCNGSDVLENNEMPRGSSDNWGPSTRLLK